MCLVKVVKKFQFFENKGVLHNKTPIGASCFDVTSLVIVHWVVVIHGVVVPVHGIGKAVPVHGVVVPVHGIGKAVPVHGVGIIVPVHGVGIDVSAHRGAIIIIGHWVIIGVSHGVVILHWIGIVAHWIWVVLLASRVVVSTVVWVLGLCLVSILGLGFLSNDWECKHGIHGLLLWVDWVIIIHGVAPRWVTIIRIPWAVVGIGWVIVERSPLVVVWPPLVVWVALARVVAIVPTVITISIIVLAWPVTILVIWVVLACWYWNSAPTARASAPKRA